VTGELISDVIVPPRGAGVVAGSPSTAGGGSNDATGSPTPLGALAATAVIILLLGLGAGRELRWRRPAPPLSP
jgi:hypothetical protein